MIQRTRAYETERDIQRGVLLGASLNRLTLTGYVFDPDLEKPSYVFALEAAF